MTLRAISLFACSLVLAACASSPTSSKSSEAIGATDAGEDAEVAPSDVTPTDGALVCATKVWTSSSAAIEVRSFSYFEGSSGYTRTRAELTAAQLTALEGLCVGKVTATKQPSDLEEFRVTITDRDGTKIEYQGNTHDAGIAGDTRFSYASFAPFVATYSCRHVKQDGVSGDAGVFGPSGAALVANDGCLHGALGRHRFTLRVDTTAADYEVRTVLCQGGANVSLLGLDGTPLATGAPVSSDAGACSSVKHRFAATGEYLIEVSGGVGDVLFRITTDAAP